MRAGIAEHPVGLRRTLEAAWLALGSARWDPAEVEARGYSPVRPVIALDGSAGQSRDLAQAGDPLFAWS